MCARKRLLASFAWSARFFSSSTLERSVSSSAVLWRTARSSSRFLRCKRRCLHHRRPTRRRPRARGARDRSHQVSHHIGSTWNSAAAKLAEGGPSRTRARTSSRCRPGPRPAKEMVRSAVSFQIHRPAGRQTASVVRSCSGARRTRPRTSRGRWLISSLVMIGSATGGPGGRPGRPVMRQAATGSDPDAAVRIGPERLSVAIVPDQAVFDGQYGPGDALAGRPLRWRRPARNSRRRQIHGRR